MRGTSKSSSEKVSCEELTDIPHTVSHDTSCVTVDIMKKAMDQCNFLSKNRLEGGLHFP